jgi:hypothetical protein
MRTLIYKRTHCGDPDPETGVFGSRGCMGRVRGWSFDAVIGVGGVGPESEKNFIARKLTWIGLGAHKAGNEREPLVTFDHFLDYGETGPFLEELAPNLANHIYGGNVRVILDSLSAVERLEVKNLLNLARSEPPSGRRDRGTQGRRAEANSNAFRKCRGGKADITDFGKRFGW